MCGMRFSEIPAKEKPKNNDDSKRQTDDESERGETVAARGFYIPFAPPATLFHSSRSSSFRSIAYARTEHICNFDGIANILRSADTGNVLPTRGSPFPPSAVAKGITH